MYIDSVSLNVHFVVAELQLEEELYTIMETHHQVHHPQPHELQVVISLDEFADDLDLRLGRANGNIYHRRAGVEGVHDGQVMVRLKKKRFIIIDYSIIPTEADIQTAAVTPHISVPKGAGKQKCATPECPKVGVPVLLYDSDPAEPSSLYMRSGLCFTCQRNLNEKRRTQRKRVGDTQESSVFYAMGPGQKRVKLNGSTVDLHSEAIILNGPPMMGAKSVRDGYSFDDIAPDLSHSVHQAAMDTERLIGAISTGAPSSIAASPADLMATVEEAAHAAVDASSSLLGAPGQSSVPSSSPHQGHPPIPSTEDINVLYDKAFDSLGRSIYLLTQWKLSWDSALAVAVARETVGDPSLADAVASAAAVVALAADGDSNSNVASLLMAADQRKDSLGVSSPTVLMGVPGDGVDLDGTVSPPVQEHHHQHHPHHQTHHHHLPHLSHHHHPDDVMVDDVVVGEVEKPSDDNVQSFAV
eukprot:Nitzschia sp. Nitz4//scaffold62_size106224//5271//6680//NITZ4_004338-RA/size106224-processed-gene-0.23-mRNA-1//1//CDS//3329555802//365//frame0